VTNQASELLNILQEATDGLLWMSESDYPFEVVYWQARSSITPQELLELTHHPPDTSIETVDLDAFFENATQLQDWHGELERETVQRYQHLGETLKTHLSNLQVYRVGNIHLDIYIIGKTTANELAGIATQAVET
jgi:hypothetical protein